jgi:hypothetical protein
MAATAIDMRISDRVVEAPLNDGKYYSSVPRARGYVLNPARPFRMGEPWSSANRIGLFSSGDTTLK